MTTVTYSIPNISCGHCVHTIQSEVSELKGVLSVVADQAAREATITFDSPATEEENQAAACIDQLSSRQLAKNERFETGDPADHRYDLRKLRVDGRAQFKKGGRRSQCSGQPVFRARYG